MTDLPPGDLRAQAQQFMALLDELRVDGSPEALAIRQQLIDVIDTYDAAPDKDAAKPAILGRLMHIEAKVTVMLSRPVRALRERLFKELKRIGKHSQAGKTMTAMHAGLGTLLDALSTLMQAIEQHDPVQRDRAHVLLAEVQTRLAAMSKR